MANILSYILAGLTFVFILSLWNFVNSILPGSPPTGLNWLVFLIAAISAVVVLMKTGNG